MDKMLIQGGKRLKGEVQVSGAKNAVLPIMVAALLAKDPSVIENVPDLRDVETMAKVLRQLGAGIKRDGTTLVVDPKGLKQWEAPYDLVRTMRASIYVMGPLLGRLGKARVSMPGGCAIGERPIDYHLKGFEALGAKIKLKHGYVEARVKNLKCGRIVLDKPSVGATANIMMAAVLAKGTTHLHNPAQEPEIIDLAAYLNKMGAKIKGAGTDYVTIQGVRGLKGCRYKVIPDRIEAGTLICAGAITKGNILVKGIHTRDLEMVAEKLVLCGVSLKDTRKGLKVSMTKRIKPAHICTMPHPGFPTDMQAQWMALMTVASGTSVITETIWENRFLHIPELRRMGADVKIQGNSALVNGVKGLSGAPVMASDLRASAALVLCGLVAKGTTIVSRIYHLDRGYQQLEKKLSALGAKIKRIKA